MSDESFKDYRTHSRRNWGTRDKGIDMNQIHLGAILRIADACETMAKDKADLEASVKYLRESRDRARDMAELNKRRAASYKGQVTRLKNKLARIKEEIGE